MVVPTVKVFTFPVDKEIAGIYDVVSLKNTGINSELFFNSDIFNSGKLVVSSKAVTNPLEVDSNKSFITSILFSGKNKYPQVYNIPYYIGSTLINTYRLIFKDDNSPVNPIITSVVKTIEANESYRFTVSDFESSFFDPNGDFLEGIELLGDVSNFKLNGLPYVAGTKIDRRNISNLVYFDLTATESYVLVVEWRTRVS